MLSVQSEDCTNSDRIYDLVSLVVHCGIGPNRGHYIAVVKRDGFLVGFRWWNCRCKSKFIRRRQSQADLFVVFVNLAAWSVQFWRILRCFTRHWSPIGNQLHSILWKSRRLTDGRTDGWTNGRVFVAEKKFALQSLQQHCTSHILFSKLDWLFFHIRSRLCYKEIRRKQRNEQINVFIHFSSLS